MRPLLQGLDDVVTVPWSVRKEGQNNDPEVAVGEHLADPESAAAETSSAASRTASPAHTGTAAAPAKLPVCAVFVIAMMMHDRLLGYIVRHI